MKKRKYLKNVIKIIAFIMIFIMTTVTIVLTVSATNKRVLSVQDETQNELVQKYEEKIEPVVANTELREIIAKSPEKLAEYVHITDVLYGTNFSLGMSEQTLAQKMMCDPAFMGQVSERYFKYLDEKYTTQ